MAILMWCLIGAIAGLIAKEKNRNSMLWSAMGVLFGIFALLIIAMLPPLSHPHV